MDAKRSFYKRKRSTTGKADSSTKKRKQEMRTVARKVFTGMAEPKYFEAAIQAVAVNYNGWLLTLTSFGTGATDILRVGDQITPKSFELRYHFAGAYNNTAGAVSSYPTIVRCIIFQMVRGSFTSGATTDVVLFLSNTSSAIGTTRATTMALDHDRSSNFDVLYDRSEVIQPGDSAAGTLVVAEQALSHPRVVKVYPKRKIKWDASGTGAPMSGEMGCLFITNTAPTAGDYVSAQVFATSRLNFIDA